jgi:hypothetical protein
MKTCDLNSGLGQLSHAFSQFKDRLAQIKADWNDGTLQEFEATHLAPIPARVQLMVAAVQRLAEVVEAAERECADPPEAS